MSAVNAMGGAVFVAGGTLRVVGHGDAIGPVDPLDPVDAPPRGGTLLTAADGLVTVENLAVLAPLSVTAGDGLVTVET